MPHKKLFEYNVDVQLRAPINTNGQLVEVVDTDYHYNEYTSENGSSEKGAHITYLMQIQATLCNSIEGQEVKLLHPRGNFGCNTFIIDLQNKETRVNVRLMVGDDEYWKSDPYWKTVEYPERWYRMYVVLNGKRFKCNRTPLRIDSAQLYVRRVIRDEVRMRYMESK